jgi:1-deoxy-D-xylulose-5-phosphate synthase
VAEPATPILDSIERPSDLRRLDRAQLDALCTEIRHEIVSTVEGNGGHLGSNLGAVELTIAVHRVFDSPRDVILWDTGHQAYVHKLLTGRRSRFADLRKPGGLSGYPSRAESEHDWIENSHASTALSYAHGLATAFEQQGIDRRVVAVIGDGSLTGGLAFEGLNNLGHSGRTVTIVLNDNGRSYAPTVSMLSESLMRIRNNPVYMRRQARLESIAESVPWVGETIKKGIDATKAAIRYMWEPPAFFEQLGVRYIGPYSGHDIESVEEALNNAKEFEGPTVVHVMTQKGRGHAPAENDVVKNMHDTSVMKPGSYTAAFSEKMVELGARHPKLVAITAAMPDSTGLLPFRAVYPDRLYDVGIAEQHAVTMATGLAMGGLRPVVAVYATFLTRAIDQVNLDVALHEQPVVFCLDRAGVTGDDGASHNGLLDMVLLSKVPNMTIFAPSSYEELEAMLETAVTLDGSAAVRWPKTAAPRVTPDQVGEGLSARLVREGTDVCLIGVGKMLAAAEEAAERLATDGVSCTVWDPRVVRPLDPLMVTDASKHQLVVTIEDGLRDGGIGASLRDEVGAQSPTPVIVLGVPTVHLTHDKPDVILANLGLDADGIVTEVRKHL